MNEFTIIEQFFKKQVSLSSSVSLGIGDDCALLVPSAHQELAVTTDTLVSGVHFYPDMNPYDLGYKSLAVNLSDLAAMGATPSWVTLAMTLSELNEQWLSAFMRGFFQLANKHSVSLVGGDLTQGPLTVTVQAMGFVPTGKALRRGHAQVGDVIYVSGCLGDAAAGLALLKQMIVASEEHQRSLLDKLYHPKPQVDLGIALREKAHAMIDISDGLLGDLTHILESSQVGATIFLNQIPLSKALQDVMPLTQARELALNGGDDYELCFTVPDEEDVQQFLISRACIPIGYIESDLGLRIKDEQNKKVLVNNQSYQHF